MQVKEHGMFQSCPEHRNTDQLLVLAQRCVFSMKVSEFLPTQQHYYYRYSLVQFPNSRTTSCVNEVGTAQQLYEFQSGDGSLRAGHVQVHSGISPFDMQWHLFISAMKSGYSTFTDKRRILSMRILSVNALYPVMYCYSVFINTRNISRYHLHFDCNENKENLSVVPRPLSAVN